MIYRFADYELNTRHHMLYRAGQGIRLRPKVFHMLTYLLEHRDRLVTKQELYQQVWPHHFISNATLESTLREVRQALSDNGHTQQFIQTIYGSGYRFAAAVDMYASVTGSSPYQSPISEAMADIEMARCPITSDIS